MITVAEQLPRPPWAEKNTLPEGCLVYGRGTATALTTGGSGSVTPSSVAGLGVAGEGLAAGGAGSAGLESPILSGSQKSFTTGLLKTCLDAHLSQSSNFHFFRSSQLLGRPSSRPVGRPDGRVIPPITPPAPVPPVAAAELGGGAAVPPPSPAGPSGPQALTAIRAPATAAAASADRWIVDICARPPVLGRSVLGRVVLGRPVVRRATAQESSIADEDGRARPPGCGPARRSPIRDAGPVGSLAQQGPGLRWWTIPDLHLDE